MKNVSTEKSKGIKILLLQVASLVEDKNSRHIYKSRRFCFPNHFSYTLFTTVSEKNSFVNKRIKFLRSRKGGEKSETEILKKFVLDNILGSNLKFPSPKDVR